MYFTCVTCYQGNIVFKSEEVDLLSLYPKCSILISDLHLLSNKKTRVQGASCNLSLKVQPSLGRIVLKLYAFGRSPVCYDDIRL